MSPLKLKLNWILIAVAYVVNAYLYINTIIALTNPFIYSFRGNYNLENLLKYCIDIYLNAPDHASVDGLAG